MCEYVIVFVFLIPWFLMGAGSLLVGLLALGPRRADLAELWICLPAGLALLLLVGVVLYIHFWRTPRLTISHFEFDGSTLKCVTPGNGALLRNGVALGAGCWGWWLKFENGRWVYLSRCTQNAEQLVRQVGQKAGYQHA
jgi:energy-coupling factor transporter transmembrane protein EcfT